MRFNLIVIILIIFLGFFVYANSLSGQFVWDDMLLVRDNPQIETLSGIPKLFSGTTTFGIGEEKGFYRPLQMLTYSLNYFIWGLNPGGYHLVNIILQILVAVIIYYLVKLIFADRLLALLAAVFFIVHPIHSEAIAYISGRAEPLGALFLLLCFFFYVKNLHTRSLKAFFLIFVTYCLALLSKENSIILPAILVLYHYVFQERAEKGKFTLILGLTIVYIILRFLIFKNLLPIIIPVGNPVTRIPGFFAAITNYISLLFLPLELHMEYGNKIFSIQNYEVVLGLILTFSLLGMAFLVRRKNRLVSFSIFWFFLMLLPYSNIYALNAYMAEHWLYLPSLGFFLLLSAGLALLYKNKRFKVMSIVLSAALLIFYARQTMRQNSYWKDNIVFFERHLKYSPFSARVYYNLGLSYDEANRESDAIKAYKKAIEINPRYFLAHNNLAVDYYEEKQFEQAIKYCDEALKLGYKVHPAFLELLQPYRKKP